MSTPMNPIEPKRGAHLPPQSQPAGQGQPQSMSPGGNGGHGGTAPGQQPAVDQAWAPAPPVMGTLQNTPSSNAPQVARLPNRLPEDAGRTRNVPFGRLFAVELRKMLDTRAGKWLLIAMGVLILLASVGTMFGNRDDPPRYENFVAAAGIPMGFFLPILGILAVTSEWSQRTALVSFTLEPRRARVILAKWASALLLGALSIVFAYAIGAVTTLIAQLAFGKEPNWSMAWDALAGNVFAQLIAVTIGIAFGLAFQNTPAAICAYLFIPFLVSIITSFGETLRKVGDWIDLNLTTQPLYDGTMTADGWKHFAVSHLLWLVLPMVIGFIRLNRREVKSS